MLKVGGGGVLPTPFYSENMMFLGAFSTEMNRTTNNLSILQKWEFQMSKTNKNWFLNSKKWSENFRQNFDIFIRVPLVKIWFFLEKQIQRVKLSKMLKNTTKWNSFTTRSMRWMLSNQFLAQKEQKLSNFGVQNFAPPPTTNIFDFP